MKPLILSEVLNRITLMNDNNNNSYENWKKALLMRELQHNLDCYRLRFSSFDGLIQSKSYNA